MKNYARFKSEGPVHRLRRTCVCIPEKLRNRLWEVSKPFRGLQTALFRKIYYDISRFARIHSDTLLRMQYMKHYMQKDNRPIDEEASFLMNVSFSTGQEVYEDVSDILSNIRSGFLRVCIKHFVEGVDAYGEAFIETVLDEDTMLEDYLPFLKEPLDETNQIHPPSVPSP